MKVIGPRKQMIETVAVVDDVLSELCDQIDDGQTPDVEKVVELASELANTARILLSLALQWKANRNAALGGTK